MKNQTLHWLHYIQCNSTSKWNLYCTLKMLQGTLLLFVAAANLGAISILITNAPRYIGCIGENMFIKWYKCLCLFSLARNCKQVFVCLSRWQEIASWHEKNCVNPWFHEVSGLNALAKQKSDVVWRPVWHIEHNYIDAQIRRTSFFVFCTFFRFNIDSYITIVIWMYKWSRTILFDVFTFIFCFFLVGSFLWVGLIVYIPFAETMLFNVSLSLSFSFFGRHLFVAWLDCKHFLWRNYVINFFHFHFLFLF